MGIANTIKHIASFAAKDGLFGSVQLRPTEAYASDGTVAALAPAELGVTCAVSGAKLLKALRALQGEPTFEMATKERKLVIKAGKAVVKLEQLDERSAPKMERPPADVVWKATVGLRAVSKVGWGVSTDQTRVHLSGIHLGAKGLETTNGHTLCRASGTDWAELLGTDKALVSPKSLHDLPAECWVAVNKSATRLFIADDAEGRRFRVCSLIAADFPPVDSVVGSIVDNPFGLVDRQTLIDVVKRAKLGSGVFTLEQSAERLSVRTDDMHADTLFAFMDSAPLEDAPDGLWCGRVGVAAHYLAGALDGCESDKVRVSITGSLDPIMIQDPAIGFLAVLMPYRI